MRIEMELRNMPLPVIMAYLAETGGVATGERTVEGDGWTATLREMPPAKIGPSLKVERDMLIIEGDSEDVVQPVVDHMRMRTMSGGG